MRQLNFSKISMVNFKCHESMDMEFSKNSFITIVGQNGSGKTTVIDAILFALYDTTTKGSRGVDVVRKRSKKNCCVILDFTIDDDIYRIENYKKDKKHGESKIFFKNRVNISGTTRKDTNKLIEDVVMPQDIFSNCLLFSQFMNESFTTSSHTAQRNLLDKMLNVGCYDELLEVTKESLKLISKQLDKTNSDKTVLGVVISEKQDEISNLRGTISDINNSLRESVGHLEYELSEIDTYLKENANVQDRYDIAVTKLENVNNQISKLDDIISNQRQMAILETKECKSSLAAEYNEFVSDTETNYNKVVCNTNNKIEDVRSNIAKIDKKRADDISARNSTLNEELKLKTNVYQHKCKTAQGIISNENDGVSTLRETVRSLLSEVGSKNDLIAQYESTINEKVSLCPTCMQPLGKDKKTDLLQVMTGMKSNVGELSESLVESTSKLTSSVERVNSLNKRFEDYKESESLVLSNIGDSITENIQSVNASQDRDSRSKLDKIRVYKDKLNELINTKSQVLYNKLQETKTKATDMVNSINGKHADLVQNSIDESDELKSSISDINIKLNDANSKLMMYNDKKSRIESITKETENLYTRNTSTIESINAQTTALQSAISTNERDIKKLDSDIETYSSETEGLNFWKNAFSGTGIKSILLDESIPILNAEAKRLSQLTNNLRVSFDSQTTLRSGDQRNKFSIDVVQTNNLSGLSELSAGEERMVNIVVLLCLRHLLEKMQNTKLNLLLLDEILDTLDPVNVDIAIEMIKNLSKEHTVILISHTLRDSIESDVNYKM